MKHIIFISKITFSIVYKWIHASIQNAYSNLNSVQFIWLYTWGVKCTPVQALKLWTGHTAHSGSRGIALLFHDHGTRMGWGVSVTPRMLFTPGKDLVPIVQEAGWAPGPVWTGAENLASTGIRSPNLPARSSVAIPTGLPRTTKYFPSTEGKHKNVRIGWSLDRDSNPGPNSNAVRQRNSEGPCCLRKLMYAPLCACC